MAAAYAAVANGGVWMQPHLVDHVAGRAAPKAERRSCPRRRSPRSSTTMLTGVVARAARARRGDPRLPRRGQDRHGREAAADGGGYSTSKYVASFVGFVPATRPRLVILVTVDEPTARSGAASSRRPAFQEIARFALQYLEVPPDAPGRSPTAPRPGVAPPPLERSPSVPDPERTVTNVEHRLG